MLIKVAFIVVSLMLIIWALATYRRHIRECENWEGNITHVHVLTVTIITIEIIAIGFVLILITKGIGIESITKAMLLHYAGTLLLCNSF